MSLYLVGRPPKYGRTRIIPVFAACHSSSQSRHHQPFLIESHLSRLTHHRELRNITRYSSLEVIHHMLSVGAHSSSGYPSPPRIFTEWPSTWDTHWFRQLSRLSNAQLLDLEVLRKFRRCIFPALLLILCSYHTQPYIDSKVLLSAKCSTSGSWCIEEMRRTTLATNFSYREDRATKIWHIAVKHTMLTYRTFTAVEYSITQSWCTHRMLKNISGLIIHQSYAFD